MSTTSKNISIIAILTISLITGMSAAIINNNDAFALTHSQIVHKIHVLQHKLNALRHHHHHHSHHSSALAAQIKSLENQIKNLENAQASTTTHHHHSHVHFVVVNNPHHHNHHFASGSGSDTVGRDSQSISQDNANEQHSTVLSAGANSPITNSGSNTSTQSNNNAGGNAHA